MAERIVLNATDGHVLTNGEIYGTTIYLADGLDGADFYEITKAEYDEIMNSEQTTDEDYINALNKLGV